MLHFVLKISQGINALTKFFQVPQCFQKIEIFWERLIQKKYFETQLFLSSLVD